MAAYCVGRCRLNTFVSFDGIQIAYHDEGDGPVVILLHGGYVDALGQFGDFERILPALKRREEMFREVFGGAPPLPNPPPEGRPGLARALLAAGARIILPDMRGFGASEKPREKAAYENSAMARDVLALIEHLRLDAVDVIGFSMGAGTAARLLVLHPRQVKSAILAGVGDYLVKNHVLEFPKNWPGFHFLYGWRLWIYAAVNKHAAGERSIPNHNSKIRCSDWSYFDAVGPNSD